MDQEKRWGTCATFVARDAHRRQHAHKTMQICAKIAIFTSDGACTCIYCYKSSTCTPPFLLSHMTARTSTLLGIIFVKFYTLESTTGKLFVKNTAENDRLGGNYPNYLPHRGNKQIRNIILNYLQRL